MRFSKALAKARKAKGLSQADLAEKLGVSTGTVGGWEAGYNAIRLSNLKAVAKALGVDVAELLG